MLNPIDLLGAHPTGANQRRPDPRDYPYTPLEIAEASAPFSWEVGNGPDPALVSLLTLKNQGGSGSCGGQAFSYAGQRIRSVYSGDASQRSAKYLYSQVFVGTPASGGGSSDRDLAVIAKNQGFGRETDCPSYDAGQPPTELFMERPEDITAKARIGAASDQTSFAYAFPTINIDSIAQAISACSGVILGLYGTNNGTWLTPEPTPPTPQDFAAGGMWAHYMYGAQPQIYNGKKGIWCPQSWGPEAGINGWQFLDEDYFASGGIWGAIVLIANSTPVQPPQHTFTTDIKLGDNGPEVLALQQYLAYDGEFNVTPNGNFGQVTSQALLKFQSKYLLGNPANLQELGGHICGPASRAKLNTLL